MIVWPTCASATGVGVIRNGIAAIALAAPKRPKSPPPRVAMPSVKKPTPRIITSAAAMMECGGKVDRMPAVTNNANPSAMWCQVGPLGEPGRRR